MSDRTVTVLKELFGSVTDEDTIIRISKFYNGSLTPSMEALMKITNTEEFQINGNTVSLETAAPKPPHSNVDQESSVTLSYKAAFDSARGLEKAKTRYSEPKVQHKTTNMLNNYSNKKYIETVIDNIKLGNKVLVLMRGLPGSGKSTLAKHIVNMTVNGDNGHIFSADNFFYRNNKYMYNREQIGDAHQWNQKKVIEALTKGLSPVIVDNTNLELWEMHIYASKGVLNGYIIEVLEAQTPWSYKPGELSRKSVHGVPSEKIKRMIEKFLKNITGNYLLDYFRLEYNPNNMPPQKRFIPRIQSINENQESGASSNHVEIINEDSFGLSHLRQQFDDCVHIETTVNGTNGNSGFKTNVTVEKKYQFDSKPQRGIFGNKKNGLLENYTEISDWKSIDDWECVDSDMVVKSSSAAIADNQSRMHADATTQTSHLTPEDLNNCKQLIPINRSINTFPPKLSTPRSMLKKIMLDKGIMTDEELSFPSSYSLSLKDKIEELKFLFQHIPNNYLRHILEKCNGDVNWACEILLDSNLDTENLILNFEQSDEDVEDCDETRYSNENEEFNDDGEIMETTSNHQTEEEEQNEQLSKSPNENSEQKKTKVLTDIIDLKRQIEENFVIGDDHYSKHVLKLRKKIHGGKESEVTANEPSEASTSSKICQDELKNSAEEDPEINNVAGSSEGAEDEDVEEEVESVSVRVGHDFIGELNKIFKAPFYDCSLEPVIHMPISLINQIHALWLESMCNQIDVQKENMMLIIKDDEEFARRLQEQEKEEESQGHKSEVPNLTEIMEMELDLVRYNMAHSEWMKESPNDLATKLSKQKLIKLFPDLNENVLMELLHAYNYNFGAAFEDLLLSTGMVSQSQADGIDPNELQKILAEQEKDLIQRSIKEKDKQLSIPVVAEPSTSCRQQSPKEVVELYRQEAKELLSLRERHHAKAQEYFNRKMYGSANYYSNLANLYTKKHDYVNTLAASEIVQINTKENNTLDLHTFYVKEALQVLDMYLDKHIRSLRERHRKPYIAKLFLITGRGIHSPGQQAKIKPAVKRRLKERQLRYSEVNPGLLSVVVSAQDDLTDFM